MEKITVIGAGLAGCESAIKIASLGVAVDLYEMKPEKRTPAHRSTLFAELVCSNSLKAKRLDSAAGLLKEEMRRLGSVCIDSALKCQVPAGGALAVDREIFSQYIDSAVKNNPNITVHNKCIESVPKEGIVVIATGPLTDGALALDIERLVGNESLNFYDAAAPIVTADSIDMNIAFRASRYGKGTDDYINCPFSREEYLAFHSALIEAEQAKVNEFDKPFKVYEGCMPIEVLAKRGEDSIRFGPMKPVGLTNPATGHRPWAVVQLRSENANGSMYNLVGFQTNLKFPEQKRVFSMIPGLKNAEFVRYGVMHRNSFINSPQVLAGNLSLKTNPNIFFAGQISGVEGYMESAASGILCGINAVRYLKNEEPLILPNYTMLGALCAYITDNTVTDFQPMGANFGVLPPLDVKIRDKKERYAALAERSIEWFNQNIGVENK